MSDWYVRCWLGLKGAGCGNNAPRTSEAFWGIKKNDPGKSIGAKGQPCAPAAYFYSSGAVSHAEFPLR